MTHLAFVFPGQGSQAVGMLSAMAEAYPQVADTFSEASAALGYDLWQTVTEGPADRLNQTAVTQPAILTASIALWRLWQARSDTRPAWLAGHSLGEYSALVASGAMAFTDAVTLVRTRGELMQGAVAEGEGAMAAILGLDDAAVEAACASCADQGVVAAVNFNAPGQVVIAGEQQAVHGAIDACKAAGAKRAMPLPVSVPSHCALMKPAAAALQDAIAAIPFASPTIPVVQNVGACVNQGVDAVKADLLQQLYSPVRWSESIAWLAQQGVTHIVECGPGKVLSGLNKRIDRSLTSLNIESPEALDSALHL